VVGEPATLCSDLVEYFMLKESPTAHPKTLRLISELFDNGISAGERYEI